MNEERIIGLNVSKVLEELDYFYESCKATERAFIDAFQNLFTTLHKTWGSPKAVDFTTVQKPIISEEITKYIFKYKTILSSANEAAVTLASAHGAGMPMKYYEPGNIPFNLAVDDCLESLDIGVGMVKDAVKNALDTFNQDIKNALNLLRSIPLGISFYDVEGNLLSTYNEGVTEFIEQFEQIIVTLTSTLASHIETEIDITEKAKAKAVETLSA